MTKRYQHTQIGYIMLTVLLGVTLAMAYRIFISGLEGIPVWVLAAFGLLTILFSTLTVVVKDGLLAVKFGPGLIQKSFRLEEVKSVRIVRNPWYYG